MAADAKAIHIGAILLLVLSALITVFLIMPAITFPYVNDLERTSNQMSGVANGLDSILSGNQSTTASTPTVTKDFTYSMFATKDLNELLSDPDGMFFGAIKSFPAVHGFFLIAWIACLALLATSAIALLATRGRTVKLSLIGFGATFVTTLSWCIYLGRLNSAVGHVLSTYQSAGSMTLDLLDKLFGTSAGSFLGNTIGGLMPTSAFVEAPLFGPKAACVLCLLAFIGTLIVSRRRNRSNAAIGGAPHTLPL